MENGAPARPAEVNDRVGVVVSGAGVMYAWTSGN
jgi:hypothetical protein